MLMSAKELLQVKQVISDSATVAAQKESKLKQLALNKSRAESVLRSALAGLEANTCTSHIVTKNVNC